MSHRAGLLLLLMGLIVAIRLLFSGKFTTAWSALTGNPPSESSSPAGNGGSGSPPESGGGSNATPQGGSTLFGLSGVTGVLNPTNYLSADQGVLPSAVGEINYLLPAGSEQPVLLPQGYQWQETYQGNQAGVGGEEVWQAVGTNIDIAFLHLSQLFTGPENTLEPGGTEAGVSGWPLDPAFGNGVAGPANAHLAVVYNQPAQQALGL